MALKDHYTSQSEEAFQPCAWEGCAEAGAYPAPPSPSRLRQRVHYCLHHVREHNSSWNYFQGMKPEEIEHFQKESITGHRPTRPPEKGFGFYTKEEMHQSASRRAKKKRTAEGHPPLPLPETEALKTLGLTHPVTVAEIKKAYKSLVKQHHPDVNGSGGEDAIKAINEAYRYLKEHLK